jgi:hypothetical protein
MFLGSKIGSTDVHQIFLMHFNTCEINLALNAEDSPAIAS